MQPATNSAPKAVFVTADPAPTLPVGIADFLRSPIPSGSRRPHGFITTYAGRQHAVSSDH